MASMCDDEGLESDSSSSHSSPTAKRKRSSVHVFYNATPGKKNSVCKTATCKAKVTGRNPTNLKNHLKIKMHRDTEYVSYLALEKTRLDEMAAISSANAVSAVEFKTKRDKAQPSLKEVNH